MSFEPGSLLRQRYRIARRLSQGGAGAVYLATDEKSGRSCVVEQHLNLTPDTAHQLERRSALQHANLPRTLDQFDLGGGSCLVREHVEGEDLQQRLERLGPLPEADVLQWAAQLCGALAYMHTHNPPIFHGDIRPSNLKPRPDGSIVLMRSAGANPPADADQTVVRNAPGGGPAQPASAAGDQYALAVALYHLLTGHAPSDSAQRLAGLAAFVPPERLRPDLSPAVSAALTRALAAAPGDRFRSVAAFQSALASKAGAAEQGPRPPQPPTLRDVPGPGGTPPAFRPTEPEIIVPPRRPRRRWLLPVGLGCLFLLLAITAVGGGAALSFLLPLGASTPSPAATLAASATPAAAVASLAPATGTAASAPTSAPSATGSPAPPTSTATASAEPTITESATPEPTATPAGTPIGGEPGRLAFISDRDGQTYQVFTMAADGSDVRQVTSDPSPKWDPEWPFNGTQLAWSPDGTRLLYVAAGADAGTDIWMIDLKGGAAVNITNAAGDDFQPDWCSDGSLWFTSTRTNGVHQIFSTTLERMNQGLRPVNISATHNSPREYDVTHYPNCQHLLFVTTLDGAPELWRYFLDCPACYRMLRSAKDQGGAVDEPALSPDGLWVAYTRRVGGTSEINLGAVEDRTVNFQLTGTGSNGQAAWSHDGQWLAFTTERDGNREIYVMTRDGEGQTNLSNHPASDSDPVWQPGP